MRVCKREIARRVSKGYSQVYTKYLSTPQQRRNPTYAKLDAASKANLAMKNILQHKVLIGIVEKMPQSIEMLHHLMDGGSEVKNLFADISETRMNPSTKITTRDNKFMGIMNEYLKYDNAIYDFANRVHDEQYSMINNSLYDGIKKTIVL